MIPFKFKKYYKSKKLFWRIKYILTEIRLSWLRTPTIWIKAWTLRNLEEGVKEALLARYRRISHFRPRLLFKSLKRISLSKITLLMALPLFIGITLTLKIWPTQEAPLEILKMSRLGSLLNLRAQPSLLIWRRAMIENTEAQWGLSNRFRARVLHTSFKPVLTKENRCSNSSKCGQEYPNLKETTIVLRSTLERL